MLKTQTSLLLKRAGTEGPCSKVIILCIFFFNLLPFFFRLVWSLTLTHPPVIGAALSDHSLGLEWPLV